MKKVFIYILIIICFFVIGCNKEKNNSKTNLINSFNSNIQIIDCKVNVNNDVLELYSNNDNVNYYTKTGEFLLSYKFEKDNLIIDDVKKLAVNWNNNDNHLYVYNFQGKLNNILTFSAKINFIDFVKYENKTYYLIFTNNNQLLIYNILPKGHYKFKIRKYGESVVSCNTTKAPEFYFITETGSVYKGDFNKKIQPKLLVKNDRKMYKGNVFPIGEDSFIIKIPDEYYCLNSDGEVYFSAKFIGDYYSIKNIVSENGKYIIFDKETEYKNENKKLKENITTMYETKDNNEIWTCGSLFKSFKCLAVNNQGEAFVKEGNEIVKYSNKFIPIQNYNFKGNITKTVSCKDSIWIVVDKKIVYMLKID